MGGGEGVKGLQELVGLWGGEVGRRGRGGEGLRMGEWVGGKGYCKNFACMAWKCESSHSFHSIIIQTRDIEKLKGIA